MKYYKVILLCLIVAVSFLDAKKKKSKKKNKNDIQIEERCGLYNSFQETSFKTQDFRSVIEHNIYMIKLGCHRTNIKPNYDNLADAYLSLGIEDSARWARDWADKIEETPNPLEMEMPVSDMIKLRESMIVSYIDNISIDSNIEAQDQFETTVEYMIRYINTYVSNFNLIQSDFNRFYSDEIVELDNRIKGALNREFENNIIATLDKYNADEEIFPITIYGKTYSYPMKRKTARSFYENWDKITKKGVYRYYKNGEEYLHKVYFTDKENDILFPDILINSGRAESITLWSKGTEEWPDHACPSSNNTFGYCSTNDQEHADAWATWVCQNNGYDKGVWTGNKEKGCNGDVSMYCPDTIPCTPRWERSCSEWDQSKVEITCSNELIQDFVEGPGANSSDYLFENFTLSFPLFELEENEFIYLNEYQSNIYINLADTIIAYNTSNTNDYLAYYLNNKKVVECPDNSKSKCIAIDKNMDDAMFEKIKNFNFWDKNNRTGNKKDLLQDIENSNKTDFLFLKYPFDDEEKRISNLTYKAKCKKDLNNFIKGRANTIESGYDKDNQFIYVHPEYLGIPWFYENNWKDGKGGFLAHQVDCYYGYYYGRTTMFLSDGTKINDGIPYGFMNFIDGSEYYTYLTLDGVNTSSSGSGATMYFNVVLDLTFNPDEEDLRRAKY
tara:strand:- start:1277 stop:3286 length:2010 start_codon:yes stop_codon:yes gene_type:complete